MKGLLIKDFCLLKESKKFIIIVILIAGCLLFTGKGENIDFVLGYLTMLFFIITLSTLSYDEMDQGYAFLMTLPVSREKYIVEKYIFGVIFGLVGWCIGIVITGAYQMMFSQKPLEQFFLEALIMFGGVLLLQAFVFPIQIKFGSEKGRYAMFAIGIGAALGFMALGKMMQSFQIDLDSKLIWLAGQRWFGLVCILFVLTAFVLSCFVSCRIMKKKEL